MREWFAERFGQPTPPQTQGWPAIQRGDRTLILAPTGSGKTLAAFLWGIDPLFRELQAGHEQVRQALQTWVTHLARFESHLTVEMWNGVPVLENDGRPVLEEAGFYRDDPAMRWEKR